MSSRSFGIAALAVVLASGAAALVLAVRLLGQPDGIPPGDPQAGLRVQHVIAQILLRQEGLSRDTEPLVLDASDVNAFLARHAWVRDVPTEWPPGIRLGQGRVHVLARTSPGRLLRGRSGRWLLAALPAAVLDLEMWIGISGHLTVGNGEGRLMVDAADLGRQAVPVAWLWNLLGARPTELLAWRMPRIVERLEVLPDRLVIHTRRR